MQANFLEELVAEWFEYRRYIVRRNERVGPRAAGGYEGELDIVAFDSKTNHLVHIETSTDADSWAEREKRFSKKFASGAKHIGSLFPGLTLPAIPEQQAVFVFGSDKKHKSIGGGKVILAENYILMILRDLKTKPIVSQAVPEKYPILRTLQMISEHRVRVMNELQTC